MKFWYFSFDTLCFASSFILSYPIGAPLTPNPTGSPSGMPMANATANATAIAERHVYEERSRLGRESRHSRCLTAQRASTSFHWLCFQFNGILEFTEAKV